LLPFVFSGKPGSTFPDKFWNGILMNWDDVRIFLAVARAGQILSAARTLGVNHATVGRRVSALEEALQTRLLVRRTNGCELTPEGEIFLHAAERMETEMLAAQANVGNVDAALAGTVRIGAPDGFGVSFLAPRLSARPISPSPSSARSKAG
jgi:DNA-binding transcriptional LysR family regulator